MYSEMLAITALLLLLSISCPVKSTVIINPNVKPLRYVEGENVTLTCYTTLNNSVLWQFSKDLYSAPKNIFKRKLVINGYRSRTTANLSIPNTYTIQIRDLQCSDSGFYSCIEDEGLGPDEKSIEVSVVAREEQTTFAPTYQKREAIEDQPLSVTPVRPTTEIVRHPIEPTASISIIVISTVVAMAVVVVVVVIIAIVIVRCIVVRRRRKRADVNSDDVEEKTSPNYEPATTNADNHSDGSSSQALLKKIIDPGIVPLNFPPAHNVTY